MTRVVISGAHELCGLASVFAKIVNPRAQIQQAEMELQKMDANMDGTIK